MGEERDDCAARVVSSRQLVNDSGRFAVEVPGCH